MALVRVLVAIEPSMYQEVLAFHLRQRRPLSVVVLASAQSLLAEVGHTRPHLIIASEVSPELRQRGSLWAEVRTNNSMDAQIGANGDSITIHDVSLEDLVALVDRAEEDLAHAQ